MSWECHRCKTVWNDYAMKCDCKPEESISNTTGTGYNPYSKTTLITAYVNKGESVIHRINSIWPSTPDVHYDYPVHVEVSINRITI